MKLHILAIGRARKGAGFELTQDYLKRASAQGRGVGLGPVELQELDARGGDESRLLASKIPNGARICVLDERGDALSSKEFAIMLSRWRDEGAPGAAFLIGGAEGHSAELREQAHQRLSFGRLTWPHMLARTMLAEQLYRACAILSNHPYHREG